MKRILTILVTLLFLFNTFLFYAVVKTPAQTFNCTISMFTKNPLNVGESAALVLTVVKEPEAPNTINRIDYTSDDTNIVVVNPTSRTRSQGFNTSVNGVRPGTTVVRATARINNVPSCTANLTVNVGGAPYCENILFYKVNGDINNASSWTQVTSADITQKDQIFLGVRGNLAGFSETFTKARFFIAGYPAIETTTKIPGSDIFYLEFIVPTLISHYTFGAEIFGEPSNKWY